EHASECFADVCTRVGVRLDALTQELGGQDIVCVAHAGSIRAAVALALGLSAEKALALDVKNTSLTRLDYVTDRLRVKRGGHWRVVGLNMI
ncbi:histidine phosphatase family protein, partial [Magnetovibrio blakemorei]|uniref:histidine phosphatase family protein n=1 Tax=Magnetovibrio blakemorei TaxID=28181 RepID=UPI001112CD5A